MQFAGERLMNVAWITNIVSLIASSIDAAQSLADGGAYSAAGAWRRQGDAQLRALSHARAQLRPTDRARTNALLFAQMMADG